MKSLKFSIGIILYKAEKYIPYFLDSLLNQDYKWEIEILFRDHDEELIATKEIKKFLVRKWNLPKNISIKFFSWENIWHSWWHNFLMSKMTGDIYICASNDMFYPKEVLSWIFKELVGSNVYSLKQNIFFVKSLIWDFEKVGKWKFENSLTNKVDSLWIWIWRNHYFFDIWQWQKMSELTIDKTKIFGCSWAFIIFEKTIIEKLKSKFWYVFDEKLAPHYKNDIELSYRIYLVWAKIKLLENVEVYHNRQFSWDFGFFNKMKNHLRKSKSAIHQSIFSHLVILRKYLHNFPISIRIRTYIFEFKKFLFFLFTWATSLKAYFDFFKQKNKIEKIYLDKITLEEIKWKFQ